MTVIENTLPFAPPDYDLNDCDMTWFPNDGQWRWADHWPHVAEAWEKYGDEGERRKIMDFRTMLQCRTCIAGRDAAQRQQRVEGYCAEDPLALEQQAQFPLRLAYRHWAQHHRDVPVAMDFVHHLWVYQMMGFEDLWYGKPRGFSNQLDPRDPRVQQWEYDALELGSGVAWSLWYD